MINKHFFYFVIVAVALAVAGCSEFDSGSESTASGDFSVGSQESITPLELKSFICEAIEVCDPEGYAEMIDALGQCESEIADWAENCENYDGTAAADCIREATLDNLSDFSCDMDMETPPAPQSCENICVEDTDNGTPHAG